MASSVCIKLINISFYLSANAGLSMCKIQKENVAYQSLFSPAVPNMSFSSDLDIFWDGKYMPIQLLFYVLLLPGLV